jgi:hypothetical protein
MSTTAATFSVLFNRCIYMLSVVTFSEAIRCNLGLIVLHIDADALKTSMI